jgi:hypothetical protein
VRRARAVADRAAHPLDELAREREAEAAATCGARRVELLDRHGAYG